MKKPSRESASVSSLDTEGLTPVRPEESHNSAAAHRADLMRGLAAGFPEWLAALEELTALPRERRARELERRAAEVAAERYEEWKTSGLVARNSRGRAVGSPAFSRTAVGDESGRETTFDARHIGQWWLSRAEGERARFERVANCLEETSYVQLTCRHCGEKTQIETGCGSSWFCHRCRKKNADKFRMKFVRRASGLINAARRAGLMDPYFGNHLLTRKRREWLERVLPPNPKTGKPIKAPLRFAQRFVTVTAPHFGTVEERIQIMKLAMPRFCDRLRAEFLQLYPELAEYSGITHEPRTRIEPVLRREWDEETGSMRRVVVREEIAQPEPKNFSPAQALIDCVEYSQQFEWTPGDDGQGHPHWHTWLFSPYLPHAMAERVWRQAWTQTVGDVLGYCPLELADYWRGTARLVVDVQGVYRRDDKGAYSRDEKGNLLDAGDDAMSAAHELVKYMLKDFELYEDKAQRAAPDVFARVYVKASGKRMRQSSAGFGRWALKQAKICPTCWHESDVGHWARIEVKHTIQDEALSFSGGIVPPLPTGPPRGPPTREQELREAYDARKEAEFGRSFDHRILRKRMADILDQKEQPAEPAQQRLFR